MTVLNICGRSILSELNLTKVYDVQVQNACVSKQVLQHLGVPTKGMKSFFWPCRMEAFSVNGVDIVLDGSHNGESVRLFLEGIRERYPDKVVLTVFGAGVEKCLDDMMEQVMVQSDSILFVQSKHFKSVPESELAARLTQAYAHKLLGTASAPSERVEHGTIEGRMDWVIKSIM